MITNQITKELISYFKSKENPTDEEKRFLSIVEAETDYFPITSISRYDLEERGFDTDNITDDQMNELASDMEDDYCDNYFWDSMENNADWQKLPRK